MKTTLQKLAFRLLLVTGLGTFNQLIAQTPCSIPAQIIGHHKICVGDTSQLIPQSGGTWVSNNPSVATVQSNGKVTAVAQGTVNFTFTGSNGCVSTSSSITVAINWLGTEYSGTFNTGGVITDNLGNIFFGDYSTHKVYKSVIGSSVVSVYSSSNLSSPYGMVFDNLGNLIVCSYGANKVVKIPPGGGAAVDYVTGLNGPSSIVKYIGDTLLVQNYFDNKIYMILPGGGAAGSSQVPLIATLTGNRAGGLQVYNNMDIIALTFNSPGYSSGTDCYRIQVSNSYNIVYLGHLPINTPVDMAKLPNQDEFYITAYFSNYIHKLNGNTLVYSAVAGNGAVVASDGIPLSSGISTSYFCYLAQNGTLWFTCADSKTLRYYTECQTCTSPTINTSGITNLCVGDSTFFNPSTGGSWQSNNPVVASVANTGKAVALSRRSVDFTYTNDAGCSNTTPVLTVTNPAVWYLDADNDGWYILTNTVCASPGAGWTSSIPNGGVGDCDDNNSTIFPNAVEIFNDGIDQNCDGVDGIVGIIEYPKDIISFYPNPTKSVLNISTKSNAIIKIVNVLGETIATATLNTGENTIDVSNLVNGIYFIRNINGGASVKFIKD